MAVLFPTSELVLVFLSYTRDVLLSQFQGTDIPESDVAAHRYPNSMQFDNQRRNRSYSHSRQIVNGQQEIPAGRWPCHD